MASERYLTVEEAAAYFSIPDGDDEATAQLDVFLDVAEDLIEEAIGESLVPEDGTARLFSGRTDKILFLPYLRSVSSVRIGADTATPLPLHESAYALYPQMPKHGVFSGLVLKTGGNWPKGHLNIEVTADWGFPPPDQSPPMAVVPGSIKFVIFMIMKRLFAERDRPDFVEFESTYARSTRYFSERNITLVPDHAMGILRKFENRWRAV